MGRSNSKWQTGMKVEYSFYDNAWEHQTTTVTVLGVSYKMLYVEFTDGTRKFIKKGSVRSI